MKDRVFRLWWFGVSILGGVSACLMTFNARATELLIKPEHFEVEVGRPLSFSVISTDVFIQPSELEPKRFVEAALWQKGKSFALPLVENEAAIQLQGVLTLSEPMSAWLVAHRKGVVWSKTSQGMKLGGRSSAPDSEWSARYEKFVKLKLNAHQDDVEFATPLGHALEIVPVTNLAEIVVGKDVEVRVLLRGQPTMADLVATWDGFADTPSTFTYFTQTYSSDENGDPRARIRISHSGVWLVRTEVKSLAKGEPFDYEIMRAVLEFEVK
ncbi:putative DUF4198 domain-containing protein [Azospirillaceae bacterium]